MSRVIIVGLTVVLASALPACGSDAPEDPMQEEESSRAAFLRVDIAKVGDAIEIESVRVVNVERDSALIPSLGGDLMLVSYADGAVHEAMPFHFPAEAIVETFHEDGVQSRRVPVTDGRMTLFLRDAVSLDGIEVLDGQGEVRSVFSAERIAPRTVPNRLRLKAIDGAADAIAALEAEFPHIEVLDPGSGSSLPTVFHLPRSVVEDLHPMTQKAAENLLAALKRVPPSALSAVRSVALGKFESDTNAIGVSFGSSVIISKLIETEPRQMMETVVHEATHTFQYLVDGSLLTALWNPDAWPGEVRAAAGGVTDTFPMSTFLVPADAGGG